MEKYSPEVVEVLQTGGVAVIPTDTIYGIVGSARKQDTVERIYRIRRRAPSKPMIILMASVEDLAQFGIAITPDEKSILRSFWPGKVSVVLPIRSGHIRELEYLHRGTHTLAFRVPDNASLRELLQQVGPLVAPSANPEGLPPAETVQKAQEYFAGEPDVYIDGGICSSEPSTLVSLESGRLNVLRRGAVDISKELPTA